jgi:AGZA family xanthine/uracil permease-like MFS transporter
MNFINNFFKISQSGSTIKTELNAGLTTFLTMSYVIFINPLILSQAGMDPSAVFTATILAAVFATALMGLFANWPIALAPGMGTNSWFVYGICLGLGYSWQTALGAVFVSGILMLVFTLLPIRKKLIASLPLSLKMSITAGVGLFIGIIGLKTSTIFIPNSITFAELGSFKNPSVYLTLLGLLIIFIGEYYKIRASVIISIFIISILATLMDITHFSGVISLPGSMEPTFFKLDLTEIFTLGLVSVILTLFIIDFFDSTSLFIGTIGAVKKHIPEKQLSKALCVDSIATSLGALFGVSTTTAYSESASGILQSGGRTGLTSIAVAFLFLLALFFSPILSMIPLFAAAPAMLYVATLMFSSLKYLDWEDITEVIPAFVILITIPITFSIFNGIGLGLCTWVILKIIFKKWEKKFYPIIFVMLAFIGYNLLK